MKSIRVNPVSKISTLWAKISLTSTLLFIVLLTILHFLKPELDLSWRMISEYAIGNFGGLMTIAFLIWTISFVGLFMAIRSQVQNIIGKIGLALLIVSALGLILAGIFTTDPVTASTDQHTTSGVIHSIGGTLGMAMPFAALFLCISLSKNPNWITKKRIIIIATTIAIIGFLTAMGMMGAMLSKSNGVFSSETKVGFPNRFEVLCYCIWLIIMAKQAINLKMK